MRWVLAMVFGVIGGTIGYALFGEPSMGGALGDQIAFFSTALCQKSRTNILSGEKRDQRQV